MAVEDEGVSVLHVGVMVSMSKIQRYCDEIAAAFKPRRIILFGSHAYGKPHKDSDVDVLVVFPDLRRLGRDPEVKIRLKVDTDFPVDMLVRSEREVERRVRQKDLFMLDVTENGKVMYETLHA
jgi:predicted nucleotidyltransferase